MFDGVIDAPAASRIFDVFIFLSGSELHALAGTHVLGACERAELQSNWCCSSPT